MTWAVSQAALAAHRKVCQWRKLAFLEVVDLQRARVFRFLGFGPIAARDKDRRTIGGGSPHLMRGDTGVDFRPVLPLRPYRALAVDAMRTDIAGAVIGRGGLRAGALGTV